MIRPRNASPPLAMTAALLMASSALGQGADDEVRGPYNIPADAYIVRYNDVFAPVVSERGMVATQNDIATQVGVDILNRGGNAIDASVAVGFALTVTLPRAGNIGGGGFMVTYDADSGSASTIDYRETAPTGVRATDFLDENGEKDRASRFTWPAVGVPGTVAGLHKAWELGGSLPWADLVAPAVSLARDGFEVNYDLAEILAAKQPWLGENAATAFEFYKPDGTAYRAGEIMQRPVLADTLDAIAEQGPAVFYTGEIAELIVDDMRRHGGHIDKRDLADYEAIVREPVRGTYRGYEIVSMPPPSSGGIAIIEILNILEAFPLNAWGHSARSLHAMTEAMKLTYADRGNYLADPAYFDVPVEQLTDKDYARQRGALVRMDRAMPVDQLSGGINVDEGPSTTHFSIVDAQGNAVSNTYTLSSSFGAGLTIAGTGVLLNNQIHTFSVRAGIPGATGFIASHANRIEDGKRPVSSQSPTIVLKDGKPFLVVGSPGGSRIITTVAQTIINVIDFGMNIAEATNQRRIHHQWIPDVLEVEPGFNPDTAALLEALGHNVRETSTMGSTQSVQITERYVFGASDPRRPNALSKASQ